MAKSFSEMTDAEKRAWADAQTAPKPKAAAPAPKAAPRKSEEQRIADDLKSMRYYQTTDDHQ